MLIVFGGLAGTGKTTIAKGLVNAVDCVGPWSGSTPRARAGERRRYCHHQGPARSTVAEEGIGST
jgi:cytidylate kinase